MFGLYFVPFGILRGKWPAFSLLEVHSFLLSCEADGRQTNVQYGMVEKYSLM